MQRFDRTQFTRAGKRSGTGRGLTICYIGDGKGKTTAAVGLAVRARGAGFRVYFAQFLKSEKWRSHERQVLARIGIPVHVLGAGFIGIIDDRHPLAWHKKKAHDALRTVLRAVRTRRYRVIVADEVISAVEEGVLTVRDVLSLIAAKPAATHLVLTGHTPIAKIVDACDIVTEMRNVKHPFATERMLAQHGIDY